MAMAMVRSALLRNSMRGGSRVPSAPPKRNFASSSHHDDALCSMDDDNLVSVLSFLFCSQAIVLTFHSSIPKYVVDETAKWEKITYAGIVTCTILAIYNLRKGHPHDDPPPPYPYLHIRNKEFPWGPDGLFERKHDHH
ncbi:hypothetical protein FEM48_Zijuj08G0135600 [Ziziphus jujuba var. spinosa]|uniref:Cytochrome c oxidase subunit 6a, mitochondrial-like n=1 Tax=Ziziphus jujuba var. spinosa TaxID=714518 RepID=A0A978UZE3_ZIZJJ|nr:hypothetical protein FEM48_Zijuj08G0135600 [Ziziphus jujuba var. spinosa]